MTEQEAIDAANEYVLTNSLDVEQIINVRYLDASWFVENENKCPADMIETHRSVQKSFVSHWVVKYSLKSEPGVIECPGTRLICVYDSGKIDEV